MPGLSSIECRTYLPMSVAHPIEEDAMTKREPTEAENDAWRIEEDRITGQLIRQHGVFIQSVRGEPMFRMTCFAYTVGLFGMGHPELLVLGICGQTAGHLLNEVSARVRAG